MRWHYYAQVDVETDKIVFKHLRASGVVKTASSEEHTECQDMAGNGLSVSTHHALQRTYKHPCQGSADPWHHHSTQMLCGT